MRFLFASPPIKRKSRVFSSRIPNLTKKHSFSLLKSPIYAKITNFLFSNPPFMWKTRVFSTKIPHLTRKSCVFSNLPFKQKTRDFSSEIPHLTRKSRIFSSQIRRLSKKHAFSLQESSISPENLAFSFRESPI